MSIAAHVLIGGVVVAYSVTDTEPKKKKPAEVTFVETKVPPPTNNEPPPPPEIPPPEIPPPAAPAIAYAPVETKPITPPVVKPKPKKKPQKDVAVTAPPQATPAPPAYGSPQGVDGGKSDGTGVVGGKIGGVEGGTVDGTGTAPTSSTLAFGPGMTRPTRLSGMDPQYTAQALAARVSGLMIVKCVITIEGKLEDCRVAKGIEHMNEAVLAALATHRYTPVMFQGRPVRVNYVFNIKLVAPE